MEYWNCFELLVPCIGNASGLEEAVKAMPGYL